MGIPIRPYPLIDGRVHFPPLQTLIPKEHLFSTVPYNHPQPLLPLRRAWLSCSHSHTSLDKLHMQRNRFYLTPLQSQSSLIFLILSGASSMSMVILNGAVGLRKVVLVSLRVPGYTLRDGLESSRRKGSVQGGGKHRLYLRLLNSHRRTRPWVYLSSYSQRLTYRRRNRRELLSNPSMNQHGKVGLILRGSRYWDGRSLGGKFSGGELVRMGH